MPASDDPTTVRPADDPTTVLPRYAMPGRGEAPFPRRRGNGAIAMGTLALTFAAGIWLFLAPFLLDYQDGARVWVTATENHVITGVVLVAVSGLTLLGFTALSVHDAVRAQRRGNPSEPRDHPAGMPSPR